MQARVEPLRGVGRRHLAGQHETHLVVIGAGVLLGREIAALPAPISPRAGQPVKNLLGRGLAGALGLVRRCHGAPQELRNALFLDLLELDRNAGLAEIFLRDHIAGNLAPAGGHFHLVQPEYGGAVGIADLRARGDEFELGICILTCLGEFAFNFHCCPVTSALRLWWLRTSLMAGACCCGCQAVRKPAASARAACSDPGAGARCSEISSSLPLPAATISCGLTIRPHKVAY